MIEYNKGFLGLPSLTHWYGSVLPRCAIPGLASAAMTMLVFFFNRDESWDQFDPAAFQSLNFVVGFMVIYRTQQAYARCPPPARRSGAGLFARSHARRASRTQVLARPGGLPEDVRILGVGLHPHLLLRQERAAPCSDAV